MIIEKITPYGKTRSKVLFEEGLVLMLYNGELGRLHLTEGTEVSEEMYSQKILPTLKKRAKERLVYILKASDKPEAELRRKLKEGCYPDEAIDEAISWAKSKHYVDDERYVETYLRYHAEGKSKKKLFYDLCAKGISKELIANMLEDTEIDETEQIKAELIKRHYSEDMDEKEKQKIYAALARKGYSWSAVSQAVYLLTHSD